jgi:cobalt/nickel transport system permease protein
VGAVLAAILLGPWAACIAVSVALVVQALLFGDGGVTAIGANCFNMAFIQVFTGYYLYRIISGSTPVTSGRRVAAAGIAGYTALNIAAFSAAVMFGIQPLLHKTAGGESLYCPYGLNISLPAMVGEHLLVFGWVEAVVTAAVVRYLQKQSPDLLGGGEAKA